MRVSREQAAENRKRIVEAAGALFRTRGFSGIGVADIMKAADLTHGGFYGHFSSKDDLVAQACREAMVRAVANWERTAAQAQGDPFAALLKRYLTSDHRDDRGHGCIFAALGGDAARSGPMVREVFADGLDQLIEILARCAPGATKAARRRKALAAMSGLVGALLLARAVGRPELSDEILE